MFSDLLPVRLMAGIVISTSGVRQASVTEVPDNHSYLGMTALHIEKSNVSLTAKCVPLNYAGNAQPFSQKMPGADLYAL